MPDTEASKAKLYTVEQAAEYLSVSTKTVRRYVDSGRLTARKIKNVWYMDKAVLDPLRGRVGRRGPRVPEPMPAAPIEFLEKLEKTLEGLNGKLSDIDGRLYLFSQERETRKIGGGLDERDREIENLKTVNESLAAGNERLMSENERLAAEKERTEESLRIASREVEQFRQNGPKDSLAIKNKSEEIDELKAIITSNQRGLSLLREELADHREQIKQKDALIKDLKARLLELEQELAEHKRAKKTGTLLGRRKI